MGSSTSNGGPGLKETKDPFRCVPLRSSLNVSSLLTQLRLVKGIWGDPRKFSSRQWQHKARIQHGDALNTFQAL